MDIIHHAFDMGFGDVHISESIDETEHGDNADAGCQCPDLLEDGAAVPAEGDTAIQHPDGTFTLERLHQAFFREWAEHAQFNQAHLDAFLALAVDHGSGGAHGAT